MPKSPPDNLTALREAAPPPRRKKKRPLEEPDLLQTQVRETVSVQQTTDLQQIQREAERQEREAEREQRRLEQSLDQGAELALARERFAFTETPESRIASLEKASQGRLPSMVSWALTNQTMDEQRIVQVAQRVARESDLEPRWLFGDTRYASYTDPVWGGPVRLDTLQRMQENGVEPMLVAALYAKYVDPKTGKIRLPRLTRVMKQLGGIVMVSAMESGSVTPPQFETLPNGRKVPVGIPEISTAVIAEMMNALSATKESFVVSEALAIAADLAWRGIDPEVLKNNIRQVDAHARNTGKYNDREQFTQQYAGGQRGMEQWPTRPAWGGQPAQEKPERYITNIDIVSLAAAAAQEGFTFRGSHDIQKFLNPVFRNLEAAGRQAREGLLPEGATRQDEELVAGLIGRNETLEQASAATASIEALATLPTDEAAGVVQRQISEAFNYDDIDLQGKDWFELAKEINRDIELSQVAWQKTWWGGPTSSVLEFANGMWSSFMGMVHDQVGGLGAALSSDIDIGDVARHSQRIAAGQENFAEAMNREFGVPTWVGYSFEFVLGWYADPFYIAGKGAMVARMARVAPELAQAQRLHVLDALVTAGRKVTGSADLDTLARSLASGQDLLTPSLQKVGKTAQRMQDRAAIQSRIYEKATRETAEVRALGLIRVADNEAEYTRFLRRFRNSREERIAYDPKFMEFAREPIADLVQQGKMAEAHELATKVFIAHNSQVVPREPVIRELYLRRQALEDTTDAALSNGEMLAGIMDDLPEVDSLVDEAIDVSTVDPLLAAWQAPFRLEVPMPTSRLPFMGGTKRFFTTMGELYSGTPGGRRIARLANVSPGSIVPFEGPQVFRKMELRGKRWARYTDAQITEFRRELAEATLPGAIGREPRIKALYDRMDSGGLYGHAAERGVSPELADEIVADLMQAQQSAVEPLFGVFDEKTLAQARKELGMEPPPPALTQALQSSEARNFDVRIDPIDLMSAIDEYVGVTRRMQAGLKRALGKSPTPVTTAARLHHSDLQKVWKAVFSALRGGQSLWRASVVARPAYILRVVLGEEGMRTLATTDSFLEMLMGSEFKGRWIGGLGFLPEGKRIGNALDSLMREQVAVYNGAGNLSIIDEMPRSGALARELHANATVSQREAMEDFLRATNQKIEGLGGAASMKRYNSGDKGHIKAWERVLNRTIAGSPAGQVALGVIENGGGMKQVYDELLSWAKGAEGTVELSRLNRTGDAHGLRMWARDTAVRTVAYTRGDSNLAAMARMRGVKPKHLERFSERPPVHGPSMEALVGRGPIDKMVEGAYNAMVRLPENILNRQRYYRIWYRRAKLSMERGFRESQEVAIRQGLPVPEWTDDVAKSINSSAKEFALEQNRRIMFDFTENSRFGELVGMFAPFTQPFFENLAVWGHILVSRNPAFVGRVHNLGRMANESGFIRRDENGQLVVPMDWWLGAAPLLQMAFGMPGWQLSAPLSSFNLFWGSSFDMRIGDSIVSVPVPSLAPWAAAPLQKFFENTTNPALQSWLFRYGPGPSGVSKFVGDTLLPRFLHYGLVALFGESLFEDETNRGAVDFLRMQQHMGQKPNAETARNQSKMMAGVRILTSLLFPASPRIEMGFADLQDEMIDLRERYGYEVGTDLFLAEHPEKSLLAISSTYSSREFAGERIPRMPATQLANTLLNTDGFREFAQQHPAFASAIMMVGAGYEFDPTVFAMQVMRGDIAYKSPERVLQEDNDWKAWEAVSGIYSDHDEDFAKLRAEGFYTDNEKWQQEKRQQNRELKQVILTHPGWAKRNDVSIDDEGNVQFSGVSVTGRPQAIIDAEVKSLLKSDIFMDFPVGKALATYIDGRDEIARDMKKLGIRDITSDDALDEGLTKRYDELVDSLHPDFEQFYNAWFDKDLRAESTAGERRMAKWRKDARGTPEDSPERMKVQAFKKADKRLERIGDQRNAVGISPADVTASYEQQTRFLDRMYAKHGKVFTRTLVYDRKSFGDREMYMDSLSTRTLIFASRIDLELLGLPITEKAAKALRKAGQMRLAIARDDEAGIDTPGDRNQAITDMLKGEAASLSKAGDKSLKTFLVANDTWGWALRPLGEGNSRAAQAWRNVFEYVDNFQKIATEREYHGTDIDFPGGQEFLQNRAILLQFVEELGERSPTFADQWKEMQAYDPLIDVLIPPAYWPAYGPAPREKRTRLQVYVANPGVQKSAEQAVQMWNKAAGRKIIQLVTKPTSTSTTVSVDQRGEKYADAEFTDRMVVGNREALRDPVTLAHEIGHVLGLQHPSERATEDRYRPWREKKGGGVPAVGLMGADDGQRINGPSAGEVAWVLAHDPLLGSPREKAYAVDQEDDDGGPAPRGAGERKPATERQGKIPKTPKIDASESPVDGYGGGGYGGGGSSGGGGTTATNEPTFSPQYTIKEGSGRLLTFIDELRQARENGNEQRVKELMGKIRDLRKHLRRVLAERGLNNNQVTEAMKALGESRQSFLQLVKDYAGGGDATEPTA